MGRSSTTATRRTPACTSPWRLPSATGAAATPRLSTAGPTPPGARPEAAPRGVMVAAFALDVPLPTATRDAPIPDVVFFAFPADSTKPPLVTGSTLPREDVAPAIAAVRAGALSAGADSGLAWATQVRGEHLVGLAAPVLSAAGDPFGGVLAVRPPGRPP